MASFDIMELKQIRLFVMLADELHFGRAAARAGVTQSVMSQQIRRLEDQLGVALFNRTTRDVSLTSAGTVFRGEAIAVLRRVEQAQQATAAIATGVGRFIRIGVTTAVIASEIMRRIAKFRLAYPTIQISIREMGTIELETGLGDGEIDLAILHPPLDRSNLSITHLGIDPFDLVYAPSLFDLGSQRGSPSWAQIFDQPLVFYVRRRAPRLYDGFIGFAHTHGFQANIVAEAETFSAAIAMARAGLGIAFLPRPFVSTVADLSVEELGPDNPLSLETAVAIHDSNIDDIVISELRKTICG